MNRGEAMNSEFLTKCLVSQLSDLLDSGHSVSVAGVELLMDVIKFWQAHFQKF